MGALLIIKKVRREKLNAEVDFIFGRLGVENRVRNHNTVFIKPNIFCRESSDTGATTDMELLAVVIEYFTKRGKRVLVGEAGANQFTETRMFVELGLEQFCEEHNAKFLNLNECPFDNIELEIKGKKYSFKAPVPLLEPHFLVNLPKFKTHLSTRISWAIKNLYGLLPDKEKWLGHQIGIHETLIALSRRFRAHVVLMDGIVAMKGLGPTMGLAEKKNLLFGAQDQFVHDVGLLQLLNITCVPHVENCTDGEPLEIEYEFLNEDSLAVDHQSLEIDLRLPPLLLNRFFCKTNQIFYTLAPRIEKVMNPKTILNILVDRRFVGLVRRVQQMLKI